MTAHPVRSPQERLIRGAAVIGWAAATLGGLGALVVRFYDPVPIIENDFGTDASAIVPIVVLGITWATVGALLMIKRPDNAVGRWVLLVGVAATISMFAGAAVSYALAERSDAFMLTRLIGWLGGLATVLGSVVFYLAMIFPTGRGQTPRWDRAAKILLAALVAAIVLVVTTPGPLHPFRTIENPLGFGPDLRPLLGERYGPMVLLLAASVCTPIAVVAMVTRYRASGQVERTQLRWFISAIVLMTSTLAVIGVASVNEISRLTEVSLVAFGLAGTMVPIAIGIAILRYRLYDIDRIISRTLSWAAVTGVLLVVFVGAVVGLQGLLAGFTQGQTLAVAGSTILAFALFQPLRRRIQQAIDRRFDRSRYHADLVVAALGDRLSHVVDLDTLLGEIERVAEETVRPTSSVVWLRAGANRPAGRGS
jgi:hypothetical protein